MDLVKVRLQLLGEGGRGTSVPNPFVLALSIIKQGGVRGLYDGLSAAMLRQVTYGTSRLGLFFTFDSMLQERAAGRDTSVGFAERAGAGLLAGALGAMIGTPAEVALIRMQSDGVKPPVERANYRSVTDALVRTTREQGVRALWKGGSPTIIRAMATNFGQLSFFSQTKQALGKWTASSEQTRSVIASGVAGVSAAFFSMPFDFVKTRLQAAPRRGHIAYKGLFHCFLTVARVEGVARFYRGFGAYFMKMGPHS